MDAVAVRSSSKSECSTTFRYGLGRLALSWLLVLISPTAYAEGSISLQVATEFSVYSSGNCQRIDAPKIDLALKCQFMDKRAEFFLRENRHAGFPAVNDESQPTVEAAMRYVVANIDPPKIADRIKLWGGGATRNNEWMIFSWYGLVYAEPIDTPGALDKIERRILVRTHFHRSYGAATLVALSDFDRVGFSHIGRGVPEEVMTIFGSLDLKHLRLPQP